jgi:hypothetical protein
MAAFFKWIFSLFGFGKKPDPKPEPEVKPEENSNESEVVEETPTPPPPPPPVIARKKRALLVGIDKYQMSGADLNGCVNDVWDVYDLLTNVYNYDPDDIRILVDERATFQNIHDRLLWLMEVTQAGDEAIYYHSGHGSQVRDRNGDELTDHLDECLITHDHDWDNPFIDDILGKIFRGLHDEAFLSVIVDTCHSGTMTRDLRPRNCGNPDDKSYRKEKFVVPPADILARFVDRKMDRNNFAARPGEEEEQRHILLSGCKESETSKELRYGNQVRGAMTFNLTKLLRSNPKQNWKDVHELVAKAVQSMQNPQLRGQESLKTRTAFGGAK